MVENSSWRQGSESGTEETWSVDRANWNGEDMVCCGERMRVDKGVNVRGFLITRLSQREHGYIREVHRCTYRLD